MPPQLDKSFKAPKEGKFTEGKYPLRLWLEMMEKWLKIKHLWGVMELAPGHNYTQAQLDQDAHAMYSLLENMTPSRKSSVTMYTTAADLWRHLKEV